MSAAPWLDDPIEGRRAIALVNVVGHDLRYFWADECGTRGSSVPLAFSPEMSGALARLSVAVIGVSGAGSVVAEQLARLGSGGWC